MPNTSTFVQLLSSCVTLCVMLAAATQPTWADDEPATLPDDEPQAVWHYSGDNAPRVVSVLVIDPLPGGAPQGDEAAQRRITNAGSSWSRPGEDPTLSLRVSIDGGMLLVECINSGGNGAATNRTGVPMGEEPELVREQVIDDAALQHGFRVMWEGDVADASGRVHRAYLLITLEPREHESAWDKRSLQAEQALQRFLDDATE